MARKKRTEEMVADVASDGVLTQEAEAQASTDPGEQPVAAAEVPSQDGAEAAPVKPKLVRVIVDVGLLHYVNRFYSRGDTLQVPEDLAADLLKSGYVRY